MEKKMALNESSTMITTVVTPAPVSNVTAYLLQKESECLAKLNETTRVLFDEGVKYCPGIFDGWLCWPETRAGESAYASCPSFIVGFDTSRLAYKECGTDGMWFKHPDTNRSWSNYTTCVNQIDFEWRQQMIVYNKIGYIISLIAILVSLAMFTYFRSLKCARITLHMNLFASFAANNAVWLIWYQFIAQYPEVLQNNSDGCVVLHVAVQYFLLSNYAWMLCEGFYLHTVLVSAFISEQKLVRWLIAFGWGSPAVNIFFYALLRGTLGGPDDTSQCWSNGESRYRYVYIIPVFLSIVLNLVFLCNILRVLMLKLKAPAGLQAGAPPRTMVQAFRATLLLVPLLGLQYIVTPFRPELGHPLERTYETISAFTVCFQGLFVSILYCFCNGEVIAQVKRKWRTMVYSTRPRSNSYTATQVSFIRCGPHVPGEEKV